MRKERREIENLRKRGDREINKGRGRVEGIERRERERERESEREGE